MPESVMTPPNRLTDLRQRETRILENISSASDDFQAIRDDGLFHEDGYETWGEYCVQKWGSSKETINRFIAKEFVIDNIADVVPKGTVITASAAAAIGDLPPEDQKKAAEKLPPARKPSLRQMRQARADAGLSPKPRRLRKHPESKIDSDKSGMVSRLMDQRSGSPTMPQDASEPESVSGPNGTVPHAEQQSLTWMERFQAMCQEFVELMQSPETEELTDDQQSLIASGLRWMASVVPSEIQWQGAVVPAVRKKPPKKFVKPTVEDVRAYLEEKQWTNLIDPEAFIAFYESKGWLVGDQPMKDWRACCVTWKKRTEKDPKANPPTRKLADDYGKSGRL